MTRIPTLVVLVLAGAALGGCGKRGPVEPPPGVAPPPRAKTVDPSALQVAPATPSLLRSTGSRPESPEPVVRPAPLEPRPFVLDPLLQ